jgi:hypothetical protein
MSRIRPGTSLIALLWAVAAVLAPSASAAEAAIPWGAMYTPNDHLTDEGMTGTIKAYRGPRGAENLLTDLSYAREHGVRLIVTLGSVAPAVYLDTAGHLRMEIVRSELGPFFAVSDRIAPFVGDRTIWGVRFLDEPHDPADTARGFEVDPDELSAAFALIREALGDVLIGSTAPPAYMTRVAGAGFASGQVVHEKLPPGFADPVDFHRQQSALAHERGLQYVASLNANTSAADNETFFRSYRQMCAIETVDFATAWQWPQGHHPLPSFEARLRDPDPAVQAEIAGIPDACRRGASAGEPTGATVELPSVARHRV